VRVTLVIRDSYDIERAPSVTSLVKLLKSLFCLHRIKINIIYLYINIGYNNMALVSTQPPVQWVPGLSRG